MSDAPNNYIIPQQNPAEAMQTWLQTAGMIQQQQAQRQQMGIAMTQFQQNQRASAAIGNMWQGNATAQDYHDAAYANPQLIDAMTTAKKNMTDQAWQSNQANASQVAAALVSGDTDTALKVLDTRIDSVKNSATQNLLPGQLDTLQKYRDLLSSGDPKNVLTVKNQLLYGLAASPNGDKIVDAILAKEKQPAEVGLLNAQATDATAGAAQKTAEATVGIPAQAGLANAEAGKANTEAAVQKYTANGVPESRIPDVTAAAQESKDQGVMSARFLDMANLMDQNAGSTAAGLFGQGGIALAKAVGLPLSPGQTLQQMYEHILSNQATDALKGMKGAQSDGDVKLALQGFPDANASPQTIASFLRGTAKIYDYGSKFADVKAQWLSVNSNGLGAMRIKEDGTVPQINGKPVKPGTSFNDFVQKNLTFQLPTGGSFQNGQVTPATGNADISPAPGPGKVVQGGPAVPSPTQTGGYSLGPTKTPTAPAGAATGKQQPAVAQAQPGPNPQALSYTTSSGKVYQFQNQKDFNAFMVLAKKQGLL